MESQKIANFLNTTLHDKELPRFVTKKWIEVYDQSERNYSSNKEIRIKTSILRSDLCDFSDAYIVVEGDITLDGDNNANKRNKNLAFKNNAPFINCISKINGVKIDNAEDLDVVMPMYNLLEYSKNYRKTTGSLWNYYRDEPSDPLSSNSEYFKYETSIVGKAPEDNDSLTNAKVVIPLKHLSNFLRALNIHINIRLINCEVELILNWSKNCVLADMTRRNAQGNNPSIVPPAEITFQITDTKLYVPVVTLSKENDIKLLEQLKSGFKRTIKWNKYRSQMTIQPQNNNLNYLIDLTFTNVNRLFVLSFQRIAGENSTTKDYRDSFSYYYENVRIKDFNVLIDGKDFFDLPVNNEEEAYEKIFERNNNNDYTTGNLLDFGYFEKESKLIATVLSKQTKLKYSQKIYFIGKLLNTRGVTMLFIIKKSEKTTFNFSKNSSTVI